MHEILALTFQQASYPVISPTWLIVLARGVANKGKKRLASLQKRGRLNSLPRLAPRQAHGLTFIDEHRFAFIWQLRETELPASFRLFSAFTFHQRIHLDSSKERQYALSGLY